MGNLVALGALQEIALGGLLRLVTGFLCRKSALKKFQRTTKGQRWEDPDNEMRSVLFRGEEEFKEIGNIAQQGYIAGKR